MCILEHGVSRRGLFTPDRPRHHDTINPVSYCLPWLASCDMPIVSELEMTCCVVCVHCMCVILCESQHVVPCCARICHLVHYHIMIPPSTWVVALHSTARKSMAMVYIMLYYVAPFVLRRLVPGGNECKLATRLPRGHTSTANLRKDLQFWNLNRIIIVTC